MSLLASARRNDPRPYHGRLEVCLRCAFLDNGTNSTWPVSGTRCGLWQGVALLTTCELAAFESTLDGTTIQITFVALCTERGVIVRSESGLATRHQSLLFHFRGVFLRRDFRIRRYDENSTERTTMIAIARQTEVISSLKSTSCSNAVVSVRVRPRISNFFVFPPVVLAIMAAVLVYAAASDNESHNRASIVTLSIPFRSCNPLTVASTSISPRLHFSTPKSQQLWLVVSKRTGPTSPLTIPTSLTPNLQTEQQKRNLHLKNLRRGKHPC